MRDPGKNRRKNGLRGSRRRSAVLLALYYDKISGFFRSDVLKFSPALWSSNSSSNLQSRVASRWTCQLDKTS